MELYATQSLSLIVDLTLECSLKDPESIYAKSFEMNSHKAKGAKFFLSWMDERYARMQ
jgi:hypothetical protein